MTISDASGVADPGEFRRTMSQFATGIAVVSGEDNDGAVHGMTVNSFTSISLDPPTVIVSLRPGKGHSIISQSGHYGVSILDDSQQTYSAHFSGKPQRALTPNFVTRNRVPTLRQCLAWFECRVSERIQVLDHTLFVGSVVSCGTMQGSPLMFYASRYHRSAKSADRRIGPEIKTTSQ